MTFLVRPYDPNIDECGDDAGKVEHADGWCVATLNRALMRWELNEASISGIAAALSSGFVEADSPLAIPPKERPMKPGIEVVVIEKEVAAKEPEPKSAAPPKAPTKKASPKRAAAKKKPYKKG
jgi:hypothetical protein